MEPEADNRPPTPSKPPYAFLIPVGLAVVGFVGYQTVRSGMDTNTAHKYQYQVDNTTAQTTESSTSVSTVNGNVLTVRPHHAKPVQVAKLDKKPKPEASPTEAASPSPAPSEKATATPAPTPSHAPKKAQKSQPETADPQAPEIAYEPIVKHPAPNKPATVRSRSLAAVPGRLASTSQDASGQAAVSQPPENVAATEAPAPQATEKPAAPEPATEGPVDASDRVVEAKMSYAASPDYPDIAREQGAHGTSVVLVTVNQNGAITHMSIGSSSGSSTLDRSALAAARSSRYIPPKVDGKPAIETYRIVYDFAP